MNEMKPKWTHDCENCKYLGSMHLSRGTADWYECSDSVVARMGDDGPDYWSMPKDIVADDRYLTAVRMQDSVTGYAEMNVLARFMLGQGKPSVYRTKCGLQSCGAEFWSITGQFVACPACGCQ